MGMSSYVLSIEDRFADEVLKHIGGCEDITDLQDKLVINSSFDLLAHMSDEEKTEMMSEHWNEYWSQKGETK
jgi:uncharacterized protein (DUF1015 family)